MKLIYLTLLLAIFPGCSEKNIQHKAAEVEIVQNKIIEVTNVSENITEIKHTNDGNYAIKVTLAPDLGSITYYSLADKVNISKLIVQEQGLVITDLFSTLGPIKLKNYNFILNNIRQKNLNETKVKVGNLSDTHGKTYPVYIEIVKKDS